MEMRVTEERFELEGRALAALRIGQGSRRVLALHGWLDNAESMRAVAESLPDCEVVALDFCGHGKSDAPLPGASFHYLDHLADIAQVLRTLEWETCHLMGHSMGGGLALAYAALFADQVQSLTSIDALGPVGQKATETPDMLRKAVQGRLAGVPPARRFESLDEAIEARCKDGHLEKASAGRLALRGVVEEDGRYYWSADRRHRLPSYTRLTHDQIHALLAELTVPTLVILARQSQFRKYIDQINHRIDQMPSASAQWMDGGHHLHMDTPAPVAKAISEFLLAVDG